MSDSTSAEVTLEIKYIKESITELKIGFSELSKLISAQTRDLDRIRTQHDDRCDAQSENKTAIDKLWEKHDTIRIDLDKYKIEAEGRFMPRDAVQKGRSELKEWLLVLSIGITLAISIANILIPKQPAQYYRGYPLTLTNTGIK